jgi:hypothetical protein
MLLMEDHEMVQALPADIADQPFDIRVLPRTPWGDQHFLDAYVPHPLPEGCAVNAIPIAEEIRWGLVPGEGLHHLLRRPLSGGMLRHMKVYDATPLVSEDHLHEEHLIRSGGDDEEIHGDQVLGMVVEKCLPRRRGWRLRPHPILLHCEFRHFNPQLGQFAHDPR